MAAVQHQQRSAAAPVTGSPPQLRAEPAAGKPHQAQEGQPAHIPSARSSDTANDTAPSSTSPGPAARSKQRALVVLHGKRMEEPGLREALDAHKQLGHEVHVRVTWQAGDAAAFVHEAVQLHRSGAVQYDTIIAAGGDGTLSEVAAALVESGGAALPLALGLLPLGTGNDFAAVTGISMDPQEALRVALDPSNITPIDMAYLNGAPFINVAVAGGLSAVSPSETSSWAKRLLGPVAIAGHVLQRLVTSGLPNPQQVVLRYPTHPNIPPPATPTAPAHGPSTSAPLASATAQPGAGADAHSSNHGGLASPTAASGANTAGTGASGTGHTRDKQPLLDPAASAGSEVSVSHHEWVVSMRGGLLLLAAGNARQMGRAVKVCPDALVNDGLLDMTLLFGKASKQIPALLGDLLGPAPDAAPSGPPPPSSPHSPSKHHHHHQKQRQSNKEEQEAAVVEERARAGVRMLRVPWLEVTAAQPIHCNRDGEPQEASSRLLFQVHPSALRMHLPPSSALLPNDGIVSSASAPSNALAQDAVGSKSSSKKSRLGRGRDVGGSTSRQAQVVQHHKVSRRTMKKLLQVDHPDGLHVRRQAAAAAAARFVAKTLVWVGLGALAGYLAASRNRRESKAKRGAGREGLRPAAAV